MKPTVSWGFIHACTLKNHGHAEIPRRECRCRSSTGTWRILSARQLPVMVLLWRQNLTSELGRGGKIQRPKTISIEPFTTVGSV